MTGVVVPIEFALIGALVCGVYGYVLGHAIGSENEARQYEKVVRELLRK